MADTETAQANGSAATDHTEGTEGALDNLSQLVDRLEKRVRHLVEETGQDALADGRKRIQENPLTSVLLAMGIGLIVGLILGGRRG